MKRFLNQKGFSALEIALVIVVMGLIGGSGYYVYNSQKATKQLLESVDSSEKAPPAKEKEASNLPDVYSGWNAYTSKTGNFSIKYPNTWDLYGFQGDPAVGSNRLTGKENQIRLQSNAEKRSNNFGIDIRIGEKPSDISPYDTYGNGKITNLANGITLWEEKENVNFATGPSITTCPKMDIGNDKSYSMKLKSGKYLSMYGSFCWAENQTSTDSYQQQVNSTEWKQAVNIVKSIRFN